MFQGSQQFSRRDLILSGLLFLPLAAVAVKLGLRPIDAWYGSSPIYQEGDPFTIMERSVQVAQTGDIYTVDPPLRYAFLAVLHLTPTISDNITTHLYTTFFSYVAIPSTLAAFFYAVDNRRTAAFTVIGFMSWRALSLGRIGYQTGWWHYDNTLPFVFLALLLGHLTIVSEEDRRRVAFAIGAGLFVGIAGLNQYIMGALASAVLATACLSKRKYHELGLIGATGGLVGSILVFAPPRTFGFVFDKASGGRLGFGADWSLSVIINGFIEILTAPGYLFPFLLILLNAVLYWWLEDSLSNSNVVEGALVALIPIWVISTGFEPLRWFSMLAQYMLQYILLGVFVLLATEALDRLNPPLWSKLNGLLFNEGGGITIAIWILASGIFTIIMWTIVPINTVELY